MLSRPDALSLYAAFLISVSFGFTSAMLNSPFLLIAYGSEMLSANALQRAEEPGKTIHLFWKHLSWFASQDVLFKG